MSTHLPDGCDVQEQPVREPGGTQTEVLTFGSPRSATLQLERLFNQPGGEQIAKPIKEQLPGLAFHRMMKSLVKLVTYYEQGVLRRLRIYHRCDGHDDLYCIDLDDGGTWFLKSKAESFTSQESKAAFVTLKGVCMRIKNVAVPARLKSAPEAQLKMHLARLAPSTSFIDTVQTSINVPAGRNAAERSPSTDSDVVLPGRTRKRKASMDFENMPMRDKSVPAPRSTRNLDQVDYNEGWRYDPDDDRDTESEKSG